MYSTSQKLIAEFIGTFALIFFGAGAICADQYLHSTGGVGLLGIALAHGLAIAIMVSAMGHISGGHFNPANKKHGKDSPDGPHNGDLLNLTAGSDGKATASFLDANVTLGNGANSLFQPGGTAIVIHAGPDDYKTDPAGNSGARIACGVIEQ